MKSQFLNFLSVQSRLFPPTLYKGKSQTIYPVFLFPSFLYIDPEDEISKDKYLFWATGLRSCHLWAKFNEWESNAFNLETSINDVTIWLTPFPVYIFYVWGVMYLYWLYSCQSQHTCDVIHLRFPFIHIILRPYSHETFRHTILW